MKNSFVYFLIAVLLLGTMSCSDLVDGLNENPNNPTDGSADIILTGMEIGVVGLHGGDLTRKLGLWSGYFKGLDRQYFSFYNYSIVSSDFDRFWSDVYTKVLRNSIVLEEKLEIEGKTGVILGINKILKAHTLGTATSLWGDIPYTEAGDFVENRNPKYDSQKDIYKEVQLLLDQAIDLLNTHEDLPVSGADIFFNGDPESWIKVAYTLKARFYMHTKEYPSAFEFATKGIDHPDNSWMTVHRTESNTENLYYRFLEGIRSNDIQTNETYFFDLISNRNNSKTDDTARFGYLVRERTTNLYSPNTTDNGFFHKSAGYPLVSYEENLLILAESGLRTQGFDEGLYYLNSLRAYFNNGNHLNEFYQQESYKYDQYISSDFDAGNVMAISGLNKDQSLLREILIEKYLTLYTQVESYNDVRRTFDEPAGLDIQPNTGNKFPMRFIYPESEVIGNSNIPSVIPDIYTRLEIHE